MLFAVSASVDLDLAIEPTPSPPLPIALGVGQPAAGTTVAAEPVLDEPSNQGLLESVLAVVARAFAL
jgi:hypothetical protein